MQKRLSTSSTIHCHLKDYCGNTGKLDTPARFIRLEKSNHLSWRKRATEKICQASGKKGVSRKDALYKNDYYECCIYFTRKSGVLENSAAITCFLRTRNLIRFIREGIYYTVYKSGKVIVTGIKSEKDLDSKVNTVLLELELL